MFKEPMKTFLCFIAMAFSLFAYSSQSATKKELKVNQLFSDHMVLQQQENVVFWGESSPNQKLTLIASWGRKASTTADANGNWKIKLETPKAGGPYSISVNNADNTIIIKDVLIGEVWLASGQSNMDLPVKGWLPNDTVVNSAQVIAHANYPTIRFLRVPFNISTTPSDSITAKWILATPKTVGDFSATAYFYARKLQQELNVPVGIIQSSIGGTPAEAWTSKESLSKLGDFDKTIAGLDKLQSTIETWFNKRPFHTVPRTDEEWSNLRLNDQAASKSNFDDSDWGTLQLPGRFDKLSSGEFDGVMWLRKEFAMQDTNADYILDIGSIDDMDETYINGQKVGGLIGAGLASTPRKMIIPKSLLVSGRNIIAIRVIDTGGPGFVNGPITLTSNNGNLISLAGNWKSRLVAENVSGKFYSYNFQTNISERPDISLLNSNSPTVLFNAMINPLIPYTIKGTIWYQGESNVGRAEQYKQLFPTMIEDWRSKWGYEFPFYFVQIAPYLYDAPNQKEQSQKLRNAQRYALKLQKTGMAVTLDIGNLKTVHPANKQEVGNRLARFALANEYGRKQVTSGPLFKSATVSGNKMIVTFDSKSIGSGLKVYGDQLSGFEVSGVDGIYVSAQAEIKNDEVIVSSSSVASPTHVRYAWSDGSVASLFNKEGLPASTFISE